MVAGPHTRQQLLEPMGMSLDNDDGQADEGGRSSLMDAQRFRSYICSTDRLVAQVKSAALHGWHNFALLWRTLACRDKHKVGIILIATR